MKNTFALLVAFGLILSPLTITEAAKVAAKASAAKASSLTSAQKQALIKKSVASYKGNCPCPWSKMKNGRTCGKTSAWSKPGGAQPLCYESDIR